MMVAERSPVTLLQVRRMSCQHSGSKIEIPPPLGVDSERATCPGFHLSVYPASTALYLPGTCCSLCCLRKHVLACLCLPHTEGGPLCGGGTGVLSPTDSEGLSAPVQDLHSVKKSCFDTSSNVIRFNWRHQPPSPPLPSPSPQKREQHGKVWSAVPWSRTQACRRTEKRKKKIPLWPQSLISWTKEGRNWGYDVRTWQSLIYNVRVSLLSLV